jgi:site-specific recombinase XerD
VKTITKQDVPDSEQLRLTKDQAERLMNAPGVGTLQGLRDTAIISLFLCTGIREAELCALNVEDLRQELAGELSLHVRNGKGCKERLVPYGELDFCLAIVDKWLEKANIQDGAVFRSYYNGFTKERGRLAIRQVERIVSSYPITLNGHKANIHCHDLRRTYARRLYEAGFTVLGIQQNLGHADSKTTLGYIGALSANHRRPTAIYTYDISKLEQ